MAHHDPTDANAEFYQQLYSSQNTLWNRFRRFISFDQQAKAKANLHFLGPEIARARLAANDRPPRLLDFGSGWGAFLMKLPRQMEIFCFDLSQNAVEMTTQALRRKGYSASIATLEESGQLNTDQLDIIVCSHVLEHVKDDAATLSLFHHALRADGILMLTVPINEKWEDPKHVRHYDLQSLTEALEQESFTVTASEESDKWTGFLLEREMRVPPVALPLKVSLRCLRALLALMPLRIIRMAEALWLKNYAFTQLQVTAVKRF